jgi:dolichol kinase
VGRARRAVAAVFLVLGDLSAALIGISYGRTKIVGKKSLEGSLVRGPATHAETIAQACFAACFMCSMVCFWHVKMWEVCSALHTD